MILTTPKVLKLKNPLTQKVKWGIAGCGNFVEHNFLPALKLIQRSKLVSVYSHDLNRSQLIANKFGAPNYFNNYTEFLNSGIDTVFVASANADHHWQVIEAAKAGKNILCEKPIAMNVKEAEEMVNVCKENGVLLMVNFVHRFHPLIFKAKELVDKNLLGKIVSVSASFNMDYPPNDNFRFNKHLSGGGVLRDLGSHMIDTLRFFGGEISEIKAYMDNIVYKSEVEDFASAIVKFEKTGYGYFNVSFNAKKSFNRIEILGHKGVISIENFVGKKNITSKLIIDLEGEGKKAFRKRANKVLYMIRALQKAIIKKQIPPVTGEDALINMKIIEEIEKQCHYGKN